MNTPKGILIEGVECAGKTTLIKGVRDKIVPWDAKYLAHQPGQQFERFMYEYMVNRNIIFNRGHFSEAVYSRLWGRETPFQPHELQVLNDYARRNLLVVLCEADVDTLVRRYGERDHFQKAAAPELEKIKQLFEEQFEGVECIRYVSTDQQTLERALEELKGKISG